VIAQTRGSKKLVAIEGCLCLDFVVVEVETVGQVLELVAVWFADLDAEAVDPGLLEVAAEAELVSIDRAESDLESAESARDVRVVPGQAVEPWAV